MVLWISLGKPEEWSQDSLCIAIAIVMALEEVSAASIETGGQF